MVTLDCQVENKRALALVARNKVIIFTVRLGIYQTDRRCGSYYVV